MGEGIEGGRGCGGGCWGGCRGGAWWGEGWGRQHEFPTSVTDVLAANVQPTPPGYWCRFQASGKSLISCSPRFTTVCNDKHILSPADANFRVVHQHNDRIFKWWPTGSSFAASYFACGLSPIAPPFPHTSRANLLNANHSLAFH